MIRSFLFKFFFYIGLILLCIIFLPSLIFPKKIAVFAGRLSGYWSIICLKIFLGTKINVTGLENIIKNEKFFVACTHQSAFETFYLQVILNSPFFIIKKELTKIPIFGNYLKKIGCIWIDRDKISKDNINFFEKIEKSVENSNDPLVIFPQGKRYSTKERPKFKKGVSRIYNLGLKCLPIVMNSGDVWPKNGRVLSNKNLNISILKPFNQKFDETFFLEELEKSMYLELDKIC